MCLVCTQAFLCVSVLYYSILSVLMTRRRVVIFSDILYILCLSRKSPEGICVQTVCIGVRAYTVVYSTLFYALYTSHDVKVINGNKHVWISCFDKNLMGHCIGYLIDLNTKIFLNFEHLSFSLWVNLRLSWYLFYMTIYLKRTQSVVFCQKQTNTNKV